MYGKDADKCFGSVIRALTEMIEKCVEEDKQIQFVYKQVFILFDLATEDLRASHLKTMLMHFLKKFCVDFQNTNDVEAVLKMWKLFGECSRSLTTVDVMVKIEDSYVNCPLYYKTYAECLIENNKDEDLYFIFQKALENCDMNDEDVRRYWGAAMMSHVNIPAEDDGTVNFLHAYQLSRKSAAFQTRPSMIPSKIDEESERESPTQCTASEPTTLAKPTLSIPLSIDSPPIVSGRFSIRSGSPTPGARLSVRTDCSSGGRLSVRSGSPLRAPSGRLSVRAADAAPPLATKASEMDYHSERVMSRAPADQKTFTVTKGEDFSVFCDPTIHRTANNIANNLSKHEPPSTASPVAKRTKRLDKMGPYDTFTMEKENVRRSFDPNSPTLCRQPVGMVLDDVTMRADVTMQPMSTSTPENPIRVPPPKSINSAVPKNVPLRDDTPEPNIPTANDVISNMRTMCIVGDDSTGNGSATLEFQGPVNPWNKADRDRIVQLTGILNNEHSFPNDYAPSIDKGRTFALGGENFRTLKMIGHGAFAKVFRCETENDGVDFAVKYESPACPYEVHIVETLQRSMPEKMKPFIMSIRDAFIFRNASAIIYEYSPFGSLLSAEIYGGIITLIGLQLGSALQAMHNAQIIHADLKPDNILVVGTLPKARLEELTDAPLIRVIDFGRSIDMQYFEGRTFTGRAKTDCFNCLEMLDNRPWTYQTDFYGFVATMFVLMHYQYMNVKKVDDRYKPSLAVKRRMVNSAMWVEIFDKFLNIPSCDAIPDWAPILNEMRNQYVAAASHDPMAWRNGVEKLNRFIRMNEGRK